MSAKQRYGKLPMVGRKYKMTNLAACLAMLLFGSSFSSTTTAKPAPQKIEAQSQAQQVADVQLTSEEQRFIDLVNSERTAKGLKTLKFDPVLVEVARNHSKEMCDKSYFDHFSPTPGIRTPLDRYLVGLGHRPKWALVGENLFYCSIIDVNRGHDCLMNSESHRENILNPRFDRIGVGIYENKNGEFWVTQMFVSSID